MKAPSCRLAPAGQILLSQRAYAAAEDLVLVEPAGALTLKGFSQPGARLQRRRRQGGRGVVCQVARQRHAAAAAPGPPSRAGRPAESQRARPATTLDSTG